MISNLDLVQTAFNSQASEFDINEENNFLVKYFRKTFYHQIQQVVPSPASLLDLGGGTGIDGLYFAKRGYKVHIIDLSDNMIKQVKKKVKINKMQDKITFQQLSFLRLEKIKKRNFDLIYSNFGALNCVSSLDQIFKKLPLVLKPRGFFILVFMPLISPWELIHFLRQPKFAFRRIKGYLHNGIIAVINQNQFFTYYFRPNRIIKSLPDDLLVVHQQSLGVFVPPSFMSYFVNKFKRLTKFLMRLERILSSHPPFNSHGDFVMLTLQYNPNTKER